MKTTTLKSMIGALALSVAMSTAVVGQTITKLDPSPNPPGGLTASQVPQFVVIGWDDNERVESFNWSINFLKNKTNPAGSGNAATFDGTPCRYSYYVNTTYIDNGAVDNPDGLKWAWNDAYTAGFEISNHTHSHGSNLQTADGPTWNADIAKCNTLLSTALPPKSSYWTATTGTGAGIPVADIKGFRTPFLAYGGPLLPEIKALGIQYDCSIEEGNDWSQDGTNYMWPYTFDNSSLSGHYKGWSGNLVDNPAAFSIPNVPGLWELPNHVIIIPDDATCTSKGYPTGIRAKIKAKLSWFENKMTAFDYNLWAQLGLTKNEVVAILKHNFDLRYNNNRVPYMFGAHTGEYSATYNSNCPGASSEADRRAAIEEFINYTLTFPDTRVVTGANIIKWMQNPQPLAVGNGPFTLNVSATNGTVTKSPDKTQYNAGETVTLTAVPATDYEFESWSGAASGTTASITVTMNTNKVITANFKKTVAGCSGYIDLVKEGSFDAYKDAFGSSITLDTSALPTQVACSYTQVAQPTANDWPWVTFEAYIPYNKKLGDACNITITYTADKPIIMSLPQAPLSDAGATYQYALPASTASKTTTIEFTQFAQPSWVTPTTPLDLAVIGGVSIFPNVADYAVNTTGTFTITSLKINGITGSTTDVIAENELANATIYANNNLLVISNIKQGNYTVEVLSIDGKLVKSVNTSLERNVNTISLSDVANGIYMVKVSDMNGQVNMKKVAHN